MDFCADASDPNDFPGDANLLRLGLSDLLTHIVRTMYQATTVISVGKESIYCEPVISWQAPADVT